MTTIREQNEAAVAKALAEIKRQLAERAAMLKKWQAEDEAMKEAAERIGA